MAKGESMALLASGLDLADRTILAPLAKRLGHWPLLLKLVNAELRLWVGEGGLALPAAIDRVTDELTGQGLTAFDVADEAARNKAAGRTLEVTL